METQCLSWTFSYMISFQCIKKSIKALRDSLPGTGWRVFICCLRCLNTMRRKILDI